MLLVGIAMVAPVQPLPARSRQPATFSAGEDAYVALKFGEARAIYSAVATAPSQAAKDRAAAWRQLGVMAWRLSGNASEAEKDFNQAVAIGAELSATQAERARFNQTIGRFDQALDAANAAVASASTDGEGQDAALVFALGVLGELKGVRLADQTAQNRELLVRAREVIRPFSSDPPMRLDLSQALLEVALRLDDGALALTAWRSYAREAEQAGPCRAAGALLADALPQLRDAMLLDSPRDKIVDGLRLSQFFRLSALVAADRRSPTIAERTARPAVRETAAYALFLDEVGAATDSYYRDVANKRGDSSAWTKRFTALGQSLWPNLAFAGTRPAYSSEALEREVRARFGGVINLGNTGDVSDLHYGHVVTDDARDIDQYGHKGKLRRLALDQMVSNGYESWVWDGRQAHGGWSAPDFVVQVRPGYADGALRRWAQLTGPGLRAEEDKQIAAETLRDYAIAAEGDDVFLPGLARRLQRQGLDRLLAALKTQGVAAGEVKRAFVVRHSQVVLDSNFYAHEGRHWLDRQYFSSTWVAVQWMAGQQQEESEVRAKLSEVAFSEAPCLSWGSILNANMADETSPHGRANKRIVQGLVQWMKAHRSQIAALDASRPLMPQFDKLSDEQMRAAMRSMDPWAPKP